MGTVGLLLFMISRHEGSGTSQLRHESNQSKSMILRASLHATASSNQREELKESEHFESMVPLQLYTYLLLVLPLLSHCITAEKIILKENTLWTNESYVLGEDDVVLLSRANLTIRGTADNPVRVSFNRAGRIIVQQYASIILKHVVFQGTKNATGQRISKRNCSRPRLKHFSPELDMSPYGNVPGLC